MMASQDKRDTSLCGEAVRRLVALPIVSLIFVSVLLAGVLVLASAPMNVAHAACANPVGEEGEQIYNVDHKVMQYCDGTDWTAMRDATGAGGTSMVSGWPDAISCMSGSVNIVLIQGVAPDSNNRYFYYSTHPTVYSLVFNADGTYHSNTGIAGYDCVSSTKSISQLYTDGQAFNFVGGGSGGSGNPMLISCTNEQSDGDTTGDVAACVEATTSGGIGTSNYRMAWCNWDATTQGSAMNRWDGTKWQYYSNAWADCADGTVRVWDLNALNSGGDTLSGLSCTDGQVAAWNNTNSVWECADGGTGGGSTASTMVSSFPDAIRCEVTSPAVGSLNFFHQRSTLGGSDIYVANVGSTRYELDFNSSTQAFVSSQWNSGSWASMTTDCDGDSISQLYTDGQAFNFVGGNGSSSASTMEAGWPDAIACSGTSGKVYFDLYAQDSPSTTYSYTLRGDVGAGVARPKLSYNVSTKALSALDDASGAFANYMTDCNSKSISQLYTDGQAFNFVGGGGSDTLSGLSCTDGQVAAWDNTNSVWECADGGTGGGSASTMVDGWPDAILCNSTNPNWGITIYALEHAPLNSNNKYYYRRKDSSAYDVIFNADGTFDSYNGVTATDCNKTISQLYTDGQAFNFVGGGSGSGSALFTTCTNENSDGDTTDDKVACVAAASNDGAGTSKYRVVSCTLSNNRVMGGYLRWDGTKWQNYNGGTWYDCFDGSARIIDLEFSGGSSDTLSGLSCTDGQVAAWDNTNSVWECADGGTGGGSTASTMVDGWPDAISCKDNANTHSLFFNMAYKYDGGDVVYRYNETPVGTVDFKIAFNSDGSFDAGNSSLGSYNTDCSKALSAFEAADQTFNFVGGGSGGSGSDVSFRVGKGGTNQTVTANTWTKLTWPTENFDTNDDFASDRFTPTVAGKYLITASTWCIDATTQCNISIYKNGGSYSQGYKRTSAAAPTVTDIIDMNGTTDYLEVFAINFSGTTINGGGFSYFAGHLIGGGGSGGGGSADNLGDHTATQDLDMATNDILNAGAVELETITGADKPLGASANATVSDADNNTKIQVEESSNEDKIRFDTAGTERMIIDENGNVGIGTNSPGQMLSIVNATTNAKVQVDSASGSDSGLAISEAGTFKWILDNKGSNDNFSIRNEAFDYVFTINQAGNVGIGTTSPSFPLTLDNGRAMLMANDEKYGLGLQYNDVTNGVWLGSPAANEFALSNAGGAEFLRVDSSGNVGIGTPAPGTKLQVQGDGTFYGGLVSAISSNEGARLSLLNTNKTGATTSNWTIFNMTGPYGDGLAFWRYYANGTNAGPAMWLADNGNVGIGASGAGVSYKLHVAGTAYATGAAGALSDERHKTNIETLENGAIDTILDLRPVTYEWKNPLDSGMEGTQLGFIAQEVEEVIPSMVLTQPNEEQTKGLKSTELLPVLTKAAQELALENKKLKDAVVKLSGGEISLADLSVTEDDAEEDDLPDWLLILLGLQSAAILGLMIIVVRRKV